MEPTPPIGLDEGDQEILENQEELLFDADADGEPVAVDETSEPAPSTTEAPEEPPFPPPLARPRDPAITGKPIPWILGIRFGHSCMTYRIQSNLPEVKAGDPLLLDTRDGDQVGWVISALPKEPGREYSAPYPGKILGVKRRITQWERENILQNQEKERQAKQVCWRLIDELRLDMRVSRVEYSLDGNKAIFYFTAENRVDFRELVKVLAKEIRARVELRQIGVRDETRLLGGMGPCGKVFCCSLFLNEFRPVSVRMAKNQDLSLNPESISGLCGRLMCCLSYENDAYLELRKSLPKVNARFINKEGLEVVVRAVHPMTGSLDVQLPTGDRMRVTLEELTPVNPSDPPPPKVAAPEPAPPGRRPPTERSNEGRRPARSQPAADPATSESAPTPGREERPAAERPANRRPPGRSGPRRPANRRPVEGEGPQPEQAAAPAATPLKPEGGETEESRATNRRRRFRRRGGGGSGGGNGAPPAGSAPPPSS